MVVIFFFIKSTKDKYCYSTLLVYFGLAERSLGHAGPRLSNSMIHNCLFRETKINFCDKKKKNIRGNDVLI